MNTKKKSTHNNKAKSGPRLSSFHPRNKHQGRYDFDALTEHCPELRPFIKLNAYENESINFADPQAVKWLNTALLKQQYGIGYWKIPKGYLCPPIPGRADYIHHIADLLAKESDGNAPKGEKIRCLDIGTGANCIYPIIGNREYGWSFVGSDIDPAATQAARNIISANADLGDHIELRLQPNSRDIFFGIIKKGEHFDITVCNPPFHASLKEALAGSRRKTSNLSGKKVNNPVLNFGGQNRELWYEGGELGFISDMIRQSRKFSHSCLWFSSLVSKKEHVKRIIAVLVNAKVEEYLIVPMGHGNKVSRVVAWTFQAKQEHIDWKLKNWS